MKKMLLLSISLLIAMACTIPKKSVGNQGIKGKVVWLEGNLMPTIGDSTYVQRSQGRPVKRKVLIYEATSRDQVESVRISSLYSKVKTKLIKKIETDSNGEFKVELKPGKYSLFIQEEEGLFANVFDGQGIINPVTVETGKYTDIVIKVNYKAVY